METVGKAPAEPDLHFLTDWSEPGASARRGRAAVLSMLVHIGAILFIIVVPESIMQPEARRTIENIVTPLIEPLSILTQKEPNTGKLSKEFTATHIEPRPAVHLPPGPTSTPTPPPPQPAAPPAPPVPKQVLPAALPEPQKLEANNQPKLTMPVGPPQIQTEEKPAVGFEDVTPPRRVPPNQRVLPIPGPSVNNAIQGVLHSGGGSSPGIAAPPPQPATAELPQLLSDAEGVDFRPYLAEVLAAVKRRWFAIMPEAVKQGRTGKVGVQVVIPRDGSLGKVVFVGTTGVPALDNAAIAAISAASPFPPLPPAFKGPEIRVQINFAYNVKKD